MLTWVLWRTLRDDTSRWQKGQSEFALELSKSFFQCPFLLGSFAGVQQFLAACRWLGSWFGCGACRNTSAGCRIFPDALSGKEAESKAGAGKFLQLLIFEVVSFRGARVFLHNVSTGDAFVVRGQRDRNAEFQIYGK